MSTRPLPPQQITEGDDSEDDLDYVPPVHESDSSSDSEGEHQKAKRPRVNEPPLIQEDSEKKKDERARLWAEFQASLLTPSERKLPEVKKMVKIVKKYRFAGDDITKVEEVPEDSPDAKKWPLYKANSISIVSRSEISSCPSSPSPAASSSATPQPEILPAAKRLGPRKMRKSLDVMFASAKAKKLTTLDKSAMDWKQHVDSSKEMKEDLEANRRGGGYLEKVDFLRRVDERTEIARQEAGSKRRRG